MTVSETIIQQPSPGTRIIAFRGDVWCLRLQVPLDQHGTAWVRTNIGRAHPARREVIVHVEQNEALLHHDWSDIEMKPAGDGEFEICLALCEVGHFEAKAYFLPEQTGQPVWPPGENAVINVEPAETVCGNIIYNAFVRQLGPNKHQRRHSPRDLDFKALDEQGYTVIPPSGKFRDVIRELDFILHELGCRFIQLMPVNSTPTTYGRMGRFGSPYAAQRFTAVDPAMAEFDPRATPLEQFMELVDAIHRRHARVILDIAINHTGWGAAIHETHPHWLDRSEDGKIRMPGAWGVVWEDLTKLDFRHRDLWQYMADVFLTWCRRGVDGFRCDAGYMIPVAAWSYIVSRVREEFPDTIFFLEGLGGKISATRHILNTANFNWAYSELFQNYDRHQVTHHLALADDISAADGIMIHFAETHDNNRLAAVSKGYARMRTALCALLSRAGGFAFANGVEWFATEKIDVHGAPALNWGAEDNQVAHIRRLSTLLKNHPVFFGNTAHQWIMASEGNFIAVLRSCPDLKKALVVVINLDHEHEVTARWHANPESLAGDHFIDLITGQQVDAEASGDAWQRRLAPAEVLCLSTDPADLSRIEASESGFSKNPVRSASQQLRAAGLDVFSHYHGTVHIGDFDPDAAAAEMYRDPEGFCRRMNPYSEESRVVCWQWPADIRREVMVPPGHFVLVRAPVHFRVHLVRSNRTYWTGFALTAADGGHFLLIPPMTAPADHVQSVLKMTVYGEDRCVHESAYLLHLADPGGLCVNRVIQRQDLISRPFVFLATNGRGAMTRTATYPRRMRSRYDALLAANLHDQMPVDRWIMFSRCRAWVVYQDYSQAVRTDCLQRFVYDYENHGQWQFMIPTGLGRHIRLSMQVEMIPGQNRVRLHFTRHLQQEADQLEDGRPVWLILRPDMENRSFHETTKAFTGPEHTFPEAVKTGRAGFVFCPDENHRIELAAAVAEFVFEPEWHYMVHRPVEAERGLDANSDLFSPGYFRARMAGGDSLSLEAAAGEIGARDAGEATEMPEPEADRLSSLPVAEAMRRAMKHYVVARGPHQSVIAGYPWFLDWGRDSLIFCRGLIAEGAYPEALSIIRLFGQFEDHGTLPNMIQGEDAANRDTSDAPLWLIIACRDLAKASGGFDFLEESLGGRSLRQILFSIAGGYMRGTPNGIRMDPETGLVFSPAHFTWMDTNFPAATPRQGYPIEIQALWHAGLGFLAELDPPENAAAGFNPEALASRVAKSVTDCYFNEKLGYLSDCLHCDPGMPAKNAAADDALRPNQLFAVTMDALDDPAICRSVLASCRELLVPGAIRSLADRRVDWPVEIRHDGELLGDSDYPYRGRYAGDEDTSRKPAYHNGTAWTWVFPSFCEAWVRVYGGAARPAALAWLGSATRLISEGCLGHVPEILDGDFPHHQRGCDAQAWAVSELYRVWRQISAD
ncbi:MAG: glycogen debranching enzyme N-terminal domain-containing protein [Desulfobacterales bacterium]|nr:glycogen debranching enzyme N-terminal domain-containing protein [Desulfobacterales bacterium]